MKSFIKVLAVLLVLPVLFGLSACGEADAPEGMQLVRGGEEYGYNFYAPEEWVVASYGDIAYAYITATNSTSISFGEGKMPEGKTEMSADEIKTYFSEQMNNLEYMKDGKIKLTTNGEKCPFGTEQNAYKFIYTYDYPREDGTVIHYRAMQILTVRGGRLYIFQYNSQNAVPNYAQDGTTYYDLYLEKVNEVIGAFEFLDKPAPEKNNTASADGELVLVSDSDLCGFDFYAPSASREIASSALVHRDLGGGASVSVSELVSITSSSHPDDYFAGLKSNMEKAFGTVNVLTDTSGDKKNTNRREIKGASLSFYYEYTYTYAGTEYTGYMLIIQTGTNAFNVKAYLLNYTAPTAEYNKNDILNKMLDKTEFK